MTSKYPILMCLVIILILCSIPSVSVPLSNNINDKFAHFGVFSLWSFLALWYRCNYIKVGILGITFGLLIECIQKSLPESFHRSFDWTDLVADSIGVALGLISFWSIKKLIKLRDSHYNWTKSSGLNVNIGESLKFGTNLPRK